MNDDATSPGLTHVGASGEARMVDVTGKAESVRTARATGTIRMRPETLEAIQANQLAKGDVLAVAKLAGIMGAKRTSDLIPLCHPIALRDVQVTATPDASLPGVRVEATARSVGPTGVEMECLTAVALTLLTVYDMAKAMDRGMEISDISLAEKTGGVRGDWSRG